MIRSNKVDIEFKSQNILADFEIVKFTTSEKYIAYGAIFLDDLPSKLKAKSIVFSGEKGERDLYVLFLKKESNKINFSRELNNIKGGENLSFEKMTNIKTIPKHTLAQLLINSLSAPSHELLRFNNLSGHFYFFHKNNYITNRQENVTQIKALEVKINSNSEFELNVKTFSSLLIHTLVFTTKRPRSKYPKYSFSYATQTFKRILNSDKQKAIDTFIIKQKPNTKSTIPFINFTSLNEFNSSKIGALSFLFSKIKSKLSKYLSVELQEIENLSTLRYTSLVAKEKEKAIKKICSEVQLNIVDTINDKQSKELISKAVIYLSVFFGEKNIKQLKKANKNYLNIQLIHNKKYYETHKLKDKHTIEKKYPLHNITLEDFQLTFKKKKDGTISTKNSLIDTIVKELIIKKDIINQQVSIIDWKKFKYDKKWVFGLNKGDNYYFLTISPEGELKFKKFQPSLFNQNKYNKYCAIFEENDKVEGLIINAKGEINFIEKTSLFTIPEYENFAEILKLEHQEHSFSKSELINFIEPLAIEASRKQDYIDIFNQKSKQSFSKSEIIAIVSHREDRKNLSNAIYKKTGVLLRAYLKGEDSYEMLESNLDISTYTNLNNQYYFVGTKGKGIKSQIPRASIIRKISSNGDTIFFNELMDLMNVDFVKNGDLTVKPFPFKYLEEWIKMNKKQKNK